MIIMEQALLLVILAPSFQAETVNQIRLMPGVSTAHLLYGPYDMFVMIKAKDREEMRALVMKLRETNGIKSTITCNVIHPK